MIVGTDPANHAGDYGDTDRVSRGAQSLIGDGINYTTSGFTLDGKPATGAYICLSQYFYTTVRFMAELSSCNLLKCICERVLILRLEKKH